MQVISLYFHGKQVFHGDSYIPVTEEYFLTLEVYNHPEKADEYADLAEYQRRVEELRNDLDVGTCVLIFRAVILQAMIDLRSQSKKDERIRYKQEAIDWFVSDDFGLVCEFADVDENLLSQEIEAIIQGKRPNKGTSDFRVLRKKKLKNRMEYGDAY